MYNGSGSLIRAVLCQIWSTAVVGIATSCTLFLVPTDNLTSDAVARRGAIVQLAAQLEIVLRGSNSSTPRKSFAFDISLSTNLVREGHQARHLSLGSAWSDHSCREQRPYRRFRFCPKRLAENETLRVPNSSQIDWKQFITSDRTMQIGPIQYNFLRL
jgi:hypothetical protein